MPATTARFPVMISYARADARDFAGRLTSELKHQGIKAWMDTAEIEGGAEWLRSIEGAIADCTVFVAVRSPAARDSFWVRNERLYALNRRKPPEKPHPHIVPVLARPCTTDDLELISFQPVDFTSSFEMALPRLVERIRALSDGHMPEAKDRRTLELAYLGRILLEHSIWQDLYTPMAGVAQMPAEDVPGVPPIQTAATPIDALFGTFLDEVDRAASPADTRRTRQQQYTDILPAVADLRQLIVLGDPGCGKTTTLWRIAADYAQRAKTDDTAPLPVFVSLGQLKPNQTLEAFLMEQLGELGPYIADLFHERRLVLLLDGLNELPMDNRNAKIREIKALIARCQRDNLMAVVTCRALDFVGNLRLEIPGRVTIEPLDPIRIRTFVHNYIQHPPDAAETLFWQLAGEISKEYWLEFVQNVGDDPAAFWLARDPPAGKWWGYWVWENWLRERHHPRSMLKLAQTPYMLYMMTQVFTRHGEIPPNRGRLFQQFVDFLLLKREHFAAETAEDLKARLAQLAYTMQAAGEGGTSVRRADVLEVLGDEQRLYQAQSANMLSGTDDIRFTHQLLQEFFAARKLDAEMRAGIPAERFWSPENWEKPTGWEETAILLAGLYNDDCTPVIEWLRTANPELAARCVLESGAHTPATTLQNLQSHWPSCLTDLEHYLQPLTQAAIGRALARLRRDQRPGVGLRSDGVPDIDWVEILAGPFVMGSDKDQDPQARDNEQPQHIVDLPGFHIARYSITYAQYAAFVEDESYAVDAFWTPDGLEWRGEKRQPERYWNDPQWHIANHPVVGVTWYEAYAFTQWLSAKLGVEVSLPTEAQWEKAARGPSGLIYPYGNAFDPAKGNTGETGLGRTSAVGIFPDGASPCGVLDMSGNVWQWCLTESGWKYADGISTMDNVPEGTGGRVVRGGSWGNSRDYTRCAVRLNSRPYYKFAILGFRVVVASPVS